jgi:hypothetical protein
MAGDSKASLIEDVNFFENDEAIVGGEEQLPVEVQGEFVQLDQQGFQEIQAQLGQAAQEIQQGIQEVQEQLMQGIHLAFHNFLENLGEDNWLLISNIERVAGLATYLLTYLQQKRIFLGPEEERPLAVNTIDDSINRLQRLIDISDQFIMALNNHDSINLNDFQEFQELLERFTEIANTHLDKDSTLASTIGAGAFSLFFFVGGLYLLTMSLPLGAILLTFAGLLAVLTENLIDNVEFVKELEDLDQEQILNNLEAAVVQEEEIEEEEIAFFEADFLEEGDEEEEENEVDENALLL